MLQRSKVETSLDSVQAVIESQSILNASVVDIQQYDDTLVIFTADETPISFIRLLMKKVWNGPIEVYCTTALLAGSELSLT
ncbi:MAG: hypothetical protein GKR97_06425 [Rhizobiaceae bacterium]|nr:hypothetical protein [Rhizobiaceae bacterium]